MSDLLSRIESPADLRGLSRAQLPELCAETRGFILETVARVGGHLSANLGAVELAVALHYAYDTPRDRVVWDVGHQAYAHKVLTGRRDRLETVRKRGGISGFLSRAESDCDAFGAGHSSTAVSAAFGMAVAARLKGESRRAVAVVGDGALSGGMAFEALNNAGASPETDLLVILNDNEMSISPAVGALRNHLARMMSGRAADAAREGGRMALSFAPPVLEMAEAARRRLKGALTPGALFEALGFHYTGPVDGHDVLGLASVLANLRRRNGPQFLHAVTVKGKGFAEAEKDPVKYHGVAPMKVEVPPESSSRRSSVGTDDSDAPASGDSPVPAQAGIHSDSDRAMGSRFRGKGIESAAGAAESSVPPLERRDERLNLTYSQLFGEWLAAAARRDPRVVAVTPAMLEGSGMTDFAREFPSRCFDAGIAEQHAVTFAAGMACEGMRPVVAIYSTFLQRGYDQLIHDAALQNLPVVFAIDRAGLVGADGATHQGAFDLSYLRCLPNVAVMAPADEVGAWRALNAALAFSGPAAVRYPRGKGPGGEGGDFPRDEAAWDVGKGEVVREGRGGEGLAILAFGSALAPARVAAEALDATLADMRFVKPLDGDLVLRLAETHGRLATAEENATIGGAGGAVLECLADAGVAVPVLRLGLPDRFIEHGTPDEQRSEAGLDAEGILGSLRKFVSGGGK